MGGVELDSRESSLGALMETFVSSYRDIVIKNPLTIYEGCSKVICGKEVNPSRVDGPEMIFPSRYLKNNLWVGGLGINVSPLKMRSTHRKYLDNRGDSDKQGSNISYQRALRGLKSLARKNNENPITKSKGNWRGS
jgi:hypothetical protein